MASHAGLLFVASKLKDSGGMSEEDLFKFYDEEHLSDILSYKPKICDVAIRYRKRMIHSTAEAPETYPYLALYPTNDPQALLNGGLEQVARTTSNVRFLGGQDINTLADFLPKICKRISSHESANSTGKQFEHWAQSLVVLYLESELPSGSTDPRFSGALDGTKGHRRTTFYRRIDERKTGWLVLGEFDCAPKEVETDKALLSLRRIFSRPGALRCEIDVFELQNVFGDQSARL